MRTLFAGMAGVAGAFATVAAAEAATVRIEVTGTVEWNQFNIGLLDPVMPGDPATMSFEVDSDVFANNPVYPTRGYPLIPGSFSFQLGSVSAPFPSPMPAGVTPYFVIRNNDPGVDGFMLSTGTGFPAEIPLAIGVNGYGVSFYRTFIGATTLPSLDILDALGCWGFENLSVYHWAIQQGDTFTPLGVIYETIEISIVCGPGDVDGNGVTNLTDYAAMPDCMDGPDVAAGCGCTCLDMDLDGDMDLGDYVEMQRVFSGS